MEFFKTLAWRKSEGGIQIFDRFAGHKKNNSQIAIAVQMI